MRNRNTTITLARCAVLAACLLASILPAYPDVFGRLQISVRDADTNKPIAGAVIRLHDTAGVHGDVTIKTDAAGMATTGLLEIRSWELAASADGYQPDSRSITVTADTSTPIEIDLEAASEKVIKVSAGRTMIDKGKTSSSTQRSSNFIEKNVSGNGNSQSLNNFLIENPGFVQSTDNQVHPRGEHGSTTIDIDGAELPNATIGRGGQFLSPNVLQSADVITGAYAPEYGSEAAAVLNLNLKSGTITPYETYSVTAGSFDTWDSDFTMAGQSGKSLEPGVENSPKVFRYFLDANYRNTGDALEAPQPDPVDAHNEGTSATLFGHFDFAPDNSEQWSLTLNTTPANTEVADRTGLPSYYTPVGQGYGYGGARNATGYLPGWSANSPGLSSTLGAYVPGLGSQEQDGQDDYQKDNNTFGVLNYRRAFDPNTTALVSFSETNSITQLLNNNPATNILSEVNPDGTLTTTDNSIEFNPNMTRLYNQSQVQANLTKTDGRHTFKGGIIYDNQTGQESYQFTPQSQLAMDALANIYSFAQNPQNVSNPLLPPGHYTGATDALGNLVWVMNSAGETFPTMTVHKDGYYGAAYLQDTWNESSRFTVNYGLRFDTFHQVDDLSSTDGISSTNSETTSELSPRVNTAYSLSGNTVALLSYDKLFTQPPLAQGAIVGQVIKPETIDQYEGAVVRQIAPQQTAKIDYYYKNIRNQDDTGILIPFTQIGALTTLNYQFASVHGLEFSWNLTPRSDVGMGAFLGYTYQIDRPGGLNEVGTPAPLVNDHEQYDTLTTGLNYTWRSQAFVGATFYYGSGEASSILGPVGPVGPDGAPVLDNGATQPRYQLDAVAASSPGMLFGYVGLQLDVINVFDSLAVDNFNSGFSGTRFQTPRTYLLTATAHF